MAEEMKVLILVENFYPSKGGMQEVVRQISSRLVDYDMHVEVATSCNKDRTSKSYGKIKILEFDVFGNRAIGFTGKDVQRFRNFLEESKYDVYLIFAAQQWSCDIALEALNSSHKVIFIPTGFSALGNKRYSEYFLWLKEQFTKINKFVFLSMRYKDIEFVRKCGYENFELIPNGADEAEFSLGAYTQKSTLEIINVGSFTNYKGQIFTLIIFLLARLKNARLVLNGNRVKKLEYFLVNFIVKILTLLRLKDVEVVDLERGPLVELYNRSHIFLFSSLVECSPIVYFEAVASKNIVIMNDVGNSYEIRDWLGGFVYPSLSLKNYKIPNIVEAARVLRRVSLNSYHVNHDIAEDANRKYKKMFTWNEIARKYYDLILEVHNE